MAAFCFGLSLISHPCSSKFLTSIVHKGKINKPFPIAGETARKHWSSSLRSQEYDQHNLINLENFFPVKFMMDYEEKMENVMELLKLKEEVDTAERTLVFVDAIQRLGVASHFQEEIRRILRQHYVKNGDGIDGCYSLHHAALSFRLLRQWGYQVSAEVFSNFKGIDGRFKREIRQDIRGLLELYEATQVSFEGEDTLDEAEEFSRQLLHESLPHLHSKWSDIVDTRLKHPYHRSITRLTDNDLLNVRDLESMSSGWGINKTLTELAQMDFAIRQSIHKQEWLHVSKWWDDLGLTRELKLARHQPLKWYTWSMATLINDISLSLQRVQLTKSISFIYLIDDIFDLYGTPEELTIFTEAVEKWDYAAMEMLPDYMKMCYKALLDTTNEISHMISENRGYNPIDSLKRTWTTLCKAFLVEAKWFSAKDLPRADEYLANGKVSSGVHVVLVHVFFLLGLGGTSDEGLIRLDDTSRLISCVASILRLSDDLGSAKDEHQNGKDGSYIEYYMKEHPGLPLEQAREHVMNMITSEWKRLNKECFILNNSSGLMSFQEACLNFARMVSLMYSYDDNQRLPILDAYINFMLFNQASMELHRTK